jgi:hypothetical protein
MTAAVRDQALKCLVAEVETYDQYLTGDVYGVVVESFALDASGKEVDVRKLNSIWGIYGLDKAKEDAIRLASEAAHAVDQHELFPG